MNLCVDTYFSGGDSFSSLVMVMNPG